ncbi:DEAD-domain-containing protein [Patellaria atrata CBS 101060]|uniref:ATP-dependent RNA helicase n=1 Tax=Patellaria atrata CBS 101060 TaxID=1346257 RepID=A0A9P4SCF4_9PEZI|nr:DEAD-domain-containing protein [Patellaria atrata CBS 101060]
MIPAGDSFRDTSALRNLEAIPAIQFEGKRPSLLYKILPTLVQRRIPKIQSIRQSFASFTELRSPSKESTTGTRTPPPPYFISDEGPPFPVPEFEKSVKAERGQNDGSGYEYPASSYFSPLPSRVAESESGIIWKYANQAQESSTFANDTKERLPSLSRQLYIHAVTYLLRGLPTDLSTVEKLSIDACLPKPQLKSLIGRAYGYEREHRICESVVRGGLNAMKRVVRRSIAIGNTICSMNGGKVGQALNDAVIWWMRGVAGGVHEGVGEGMKPPSLISRADAANCIPASRIIHLFRSSNMLVALRRCPASLPRSICNHQFSSKVIRAASFTKTPSSLSRLAFISPSAVRTFTQSAWQSQSAQAQAQAPTDSGNGDASGGNITVTQFADLEKNGLIHENVVRAVTQGMGLETMTEVQTKTISQALKGNDIIAQAKTGTGKTLGFLLPLVQNILRDNPELAHVNRVRSYRGSRASASDIRALIISPTRELAEQIATEASRVVRNTGLVVQTAVGGTQKREGLRRIQQQGCHILVGTPGRLNDILNDPYTGVQAPALKCLVLDEADRLLDQGFWPEIQNIMAALPPTEQVNRQTMMFSATVGKGIIGIVRQTLKPGFDFVKCVRDDEVPTHERVPQKVVNAGAFENNLPCLVELCQREIAAATPEMPFKALIYYNSTAEVSLASSVLRNLPSNRVNGTSALPGTRVFEIHSKLSQEQRTRAAGYFRRATSAIMVSSDVTARGMDFPNVTHVIQMGLANDSDTYIHRIGRTARAGKEGQGWLVVSELEYPEVRRRLRNIPLEVDTSLLTPNINMTKEAQVPVSVANILNSIGQAYRTIPLEDLNKMYLAQLGIYQWYPDKQRLMDSMNQLARYGWGMSQPPSISPTLASRLRLSNLSGINMVAGPRSFDTDGRQGSFGNRGGFSNRDSGAGRDDLFGDTAPSRGRDNNRGSMGRPQRDRYDNGDRSSRGGFGGDRGSRGGFGGDRDRGFGRDNFDRSTRNRY